MGCSPDQRTLRAAALRCTRAGARALPRSAPCAAPGCALRLQGTAPPAPRCSAPQKPVPGRACRPPAPPLWHGTGAPAPSGAGGRGRRAGGGGVWECVGKVAGGLGGIDPPCRSLDACTQSTHVALPSCHRYSFFLSSCSQLLLPSSCCSPPPPPLQPDGPPARPCRTAPSPSPHPPEQCPRPGWSDSMPHLQERTPGPAAAAHTAQRRWAPPTLCSDCSGSGGGGESKGGAPAGLR